MPVVFQSKIDRVLDNSAKAWRDDIIVAIRGSPEEHLAKLETVLEKLEENGIGNVKVLLAHPGLAATQLQVTTAKAGGMQGGSDFMQMAQSAEDGATGIIRCCTDPEATTGDFY